MRNGAGRMTGPELVSLIESHRFDCSTEESLQDGLEQLFVSQAIGFMREARLTGSDRIDFLLLDQPPILRERRGPSALTGLGVEVKIQGSLSALTRQLHRYAKSDRITGLVVVTAKV